ncbi:hypothetical protein CANARDRAFT_27071 [[Candida] arabinofermentans NRRL YB-2248]|uniref:Uncharacterized protein n=1 Tax=[Candida] arabinofermentans NRRL YB-2248 TaxID=983967 RepID=A0A1E4T4H8_9ASCO|nr:hypothetical protein CANARDRAFT_27071 [[Candida] arabinofermentans NRRL YB-2248]
MFYSHKSALCPAAVLTATNHASATLSEGNKNPIFINVSYHSTTFNWSTVYS